MGNDKDEDRVTVKKVIDQKDVCHIIGRSGRVIKQFRESFKDKVAIDLIQKGEGNRSESILSMTGKHSDIEKLFYQVESIIAKVENNINRHAQRRSYKKFRAQLKQHVAIGAGYIPSIEEAKNIRSEKYLQKMSKSRQKDKSKVNHFGQGHAWGWKAKNRNAIWKKGTKSKINRSKLSVKNTEKLDIKKFDSENYEAINAWDSMKFPSYWYGTRETADLTYEMYGIPS